jgi:hypothetical protein
VLNHNKINNNKNFNTKKKKSEKKISFHEKQRDFLFLPGKNFSIMRRILRPCLSLPLILRNTNLRLDCRERIDCLQRKNRLFAEKESIVCRERRRSCSLVVKKFNAVKKKSRMKRLGFFFRYLLKIKIRTS